MRQAIYPGTFDPITNGHLDIIERALNLFDRLIIAVAKNAPKHPLFAWEKRIELTRMAVTSFSNIEVIGFDGLLVHLAEQKQIYTLLRGIRDANDFTYEAHMASLNKTMNERVETIFLSAAPQWNYLSASKIREIASLGGDITPWVPLSVLEAFKHVS